MALSAGWALYVAEAGKGGPGPARCFSACFSASARPAPSRVITAAAGRHGPPVIRAAGDG